MFKLLPWPCKISGFCLLAFPQNERTYVVLLSLFIFLGKCVYFSIFEWWNLQLCKKNINTIMQYSSLSTRNIFDLKKYLWVEINLTQISQCDHVSIKHESPKRPQSLTVGAGRLLASCIQPRLICSYWTKIWALLHFDDKFEVQMDSKITSNLMKQEA